MGKFNITSRRTAIFFEKYGVITEVVSAFWVALSGYFQFGASFSSSTPGTFFGVNVNPFLLANISLIIFIMSVIVSVGGGILWAITKNAPPLVVVKPYLIPTTGGQVSLCLKSEEPKDVKDIRIKILSLVDVKYNWEHVKPMGIYSVIEYKDNIIKGQEIEIPLIEAREEDILIKTSKRGYPIPLKYPEVKELHEKFNVVINVSILLNSESNRRNAGVYSGTIFHHWYKDFETPEGIITQNAVVWDKDSFKKLDKKEANVFVQNAALLQS